MRPETKATTYTQTNKAVLPTLDPTQQSVAKPFEPSSKKGVEAASYLMPSTGAIPPMNADAVRSSALNGESEFDAVNKAINGNPAAEAAKKAAEKAAAAEAEPSAFDKALGIAKTAGTEVGKKLAGDNPKAIFRSIDSVVETSGEGVGLNFDAVKSRVESAFGTPGASGELSGQLKDSIVRAAEVVGGKDIGIVTGGALAFVGSSQYKDVKSITNLIERVTKKGGALDVLDFGAQAALINGIANKLISWGVPEMIDRVIEMVEDVRFKNSMYEELCIRAAVQGDVDIVAHYANKMGSSRRKVIANDVVHNLVARFRIKREETRSDKNMGDYLLEILALFNPEWDKDPYDHNITCLYHYSIASRDAEKVFRLTDRRIHAIAGRSVRLERPLTTIKRNFKELNY